MGDGCAAMNNTTKRIDPETVKDRMRLTVRSLVAKGNSSKIETPITDHFIDKIEREVTLSENSKLSSMYGFCRDMEKENERLKIYFKKIIGKIT